MDAAYNLISKDIEELDYISMSHEAGMYYSFNLQWPNDFLAKDNPISIDNENDLQSWRNHEAA